jgi:hypothetical protein
VAGAGELATPVKRVVLSFFAVLAGCRSPRRSGGRTAAGAQLQAYRHRALRCLIEPNSWRPPRSASVVAVSCTERIGPASPFASL